MGRGLIPKSQVTTMKGHRGQESKKMVIERGQKRKCFEKTSDSAPWRPSVQLKLNAGLQHPSWAILFLAQWPRRWSGQGGGYMVVEKFIKLFRHIVCVHLPCLSYLNRFSEVS